MARKQSYPRKSGGCFRYLVIAALVIAFGLPLVPYIAPTCIDPTPQGWSVSVVGSLLAGEPRWVQLYGCPR